MILNNLKIGGLAGIFLSCRRAFSIFKVLSIKLIFRILNLFNSDVKYGRFVEDNSQSAVMAHYKNVSHKIEQKTKIFMKLLAIFCVY